jgi:hypothetical protein
MRWLIAWRSRKANGRRSIEAAGAVWFFRTRIGRFAWGHGSGLSSFETRALRAPQDEVLDQALGRSGSSW